MDGRAWSQQQRVSHEENAVQGPPQTMAADQIEPGRCTDRHRLGKRELARLAQRDQIAMPNQPFARHGLIDLFARAGPLRRHNHDYRVPARRAGGKYRREWACPRRHHGAMAEQDARGQANQETADAVHPQQIPLAIPERQHTAGGSGSSSGCVDPLCGRFFHDYSTSFMVHHSLRMRVYRLDACLNSCLPQL